MNIQVNSPFGAMQCEALERMRIRSRTVRLVDGRRMRVRMEASFWDGVDEILDREGLRLAELIVMVERAALPGEAIVACLRRLVIHYFHQAAMGSGTAAATISSAEVIPFEEFRRRRGELQ